MWILDLYICLGCLLHNGSFCEGENFRSKSPCFVSPSVCWKYFFRSIFKFLLFTMRSLNLCDYILLCSTENINGNRSFRHLRVIPLFLVPSSSSLENKHGTVKTGSRLTVWQAASIFSDLTLRRNYISSLAFVSCSAQRGHPSTTTCWVLRG